MLGTRDFIGKLSGKFGKDLHAYQVASEKRAFVTINPGSLLQVSHFLFLEWGFRFVIATAVHTKNGFEIFYHYSYDPTGLVINVHVVLPAEKPEVESLTGQFEAANWIEREMHELFGITFLNHPQPEAFISDGNWAAGVYPYRKSDRELKKE